MDIICEQATNCSLHQSDLSYHKKTLWRLFQWHVIQLTSFLACIVTLGQLPIAVLRSLLTTTRTVPLRQTQSHTETHLVVLSPQGELSFPIQLYHWFSKEKKNLADSPTRSEKTLRQLWVFPLPTANFAKLEEQRAPSPGTCVRDAKGVLKTLLGFPGNLKILQVGENFCLAGALSCAAGSYSLQALGLCPFHFSSVWRYLSLQTIPAHAKLLNKYIICKTFSPNSTVHISCDQYSQKPVLQ